MPVVLANMGPMGFPAAASSFDAATLAWVAAVVANGGTVSDARETLVNNLIVGLKADSIWTKLDRLWLFAAENAPQALTDIVADALATAVNTPTFTVDAGYAGDGSTSYVNGNFNFSTQGVTYLQNTAHISVWGNTIGTGGILNALLASTPTNVTNIYPDLNALGNCYTRVNNGSGAGPYTVVNGLGHTLGSRTGANTVVSYRDGSSIGTDAANAATTPDTGVQFGGATSVYTTSQFSMASIGGALTGTDVTNFYNRLSDFMGGAFADGWARQVVTNGGTVSAARQSLVADLIAGLMRDGVWNKLDRLWLFAAENATQALTDIVSKSLATAVNSPTFAIDGGYTGNGTTQYINTLFNPTAAAGHYTQNSAHIASWLVATDNSGSLHINLGIFDGGVFSELPDTGFGQTSLIVNDDASSSVNNVAYSAGLLLASRTGSTASALYNNNSLLGTGTQASTGLNNQPFYALARDNGGSPDAYWTKQMAAVSLGGGLTSTDATNLYSRLRTYMTAVGVP